MRIVTQGGASGSFPSLALGYRLPPRWGSSRKKRPPAASQMSNSGMTLMFGVKRNGGEPRVYATQRSGGS